MLDTGTAVVGVVIIAICFILFMLINRSGKSKKAVLVKALDAFVQQNNSVLAQSEACANVAIGLDDAGRRLFFLKKKGQQHSMHVFHLSDYDKAYVVDSTRTAGEKGELKTVDKLSLVLSAGKRQHSDATLEFYNVEYDSLRLMGEAQLIEKWNGIVNDAIAAIPNNK